MRTGRRLPWMIYAVCVLLVIDGLVWVTWQMLALERSEHEARERAERQEAIRLALWRMDGMLSPIIAAEAARPYFQYRSFYPAERAYTRMWEAVGPQEVLLPSPLLSGAGPYIKLHFEGSADGWLTSPQVPDQALRDRAGDAYLPLTDILSAERLLVELTALIRGTPAAEEPAGRAKAQAEIADDDLFVQGQQQLQQLAQRERDEPTDEVAELRFDQRDAEVDRSVIEYQARRQQAAENIRNPAGEEGQRKGDLSEVASAEVGEAFGVTVETLAPPAAPAASAPTVITGPFTSTWRANPRTGGPELLFFRAVRIDDRETLQGFWVDWQALEGVLLESVQDLLPGASLQPLMEDQDGGVHPVSLGALGDAGRLLATIPASLVPGGAGGSVLAGLTPTRTVLLVAWIAVVAAVVAIALVLRASLALSERRGRFVSAVTHELRTPLTTFCLYSQMLADGMVKDETRRGEYLGTLRRESERLAGIVENVLAYARMGSPARRAHADSQPVAGLLDALAPSLRERTEQAGMTLEIDVDGVAGLGIGAERGSVERILVNLVDNACKYAREAEDKRITLRARPSGGGVEFRVRDRGPGVPPAERRRIFSPFIRARRDLGDGTSGLGLGLSLARGVARSLGGDLRLARPADPGAEFVLWLPSVDPRLTGG